MSFLLDLLGANNLRYLTASWNGMFYVILGVIFSWCCNQLFIWIEQKIMKDESDENIPMWKLALEFWFQTCIVIFGVLTLKKVVPDIWDPFELPGITADATTGTVLLAFAILMYMDEYKKKVKLVVNRLTGFLR